MGDDVASLREPMPGSTRWRRRLVPRAPASVGIGGCEVSGPGPTGAWVVGFDNGYAGTSDKSNGQSVRLVRGGE